MSDEERRRRSAIANERIAWANAMLDMIIQRDNALRALRLAMWNHEYGGKNGQSFDTASASDFGAINAQATGIMEWLDRAGLIVVMQAAPTGEDDDE